MLSEFKRLAIVRIDQNKLSAFPELPSVTEVDASSNAITAFPNVRFAPSRPRAHPLYSRGASRAVCSSTWPATRSRSSPPPEAPSSSRSACMRRAPRLTTPLQALNLEGNSLGAVPLSVSEIKALVSLNLRDNKIANVGDEVAKLPGGLKVRPTSPLALTRRAAGALPRQEQDPLAARERRGAHLADAPRPERERIEDAATYCDRARRPQHAGPAAQQPRTPPPIHRLLLLRPHGPPPSR